MSEFERPMVRRVGERLWPQPSRRRCVSTLMPGSTSVRSGIHWLWTRGVAETDTEIWDSESDLVAMARQTYKVRMPKAD